MTTSRVFLLFVFPRLRPSHMCPVTHTTKLSGAYGQFDAAPEAPALGRLGFFPIATCRLPVWPVSRSIADRDITPLLTKPGRTHLLRGSARRAGRLLTAPWGLKAGASGLSFFAGLAAGLAAGFDDLGGRFISMKSRWEMVNRLLSVMGKAAVTASIKLAQLARSTVASDPTSTYSSSRHSRPSGSAELTATSPSWSASSTTMRSLLLELASQRRNRPSTGAVVTLLLSTTAAAILSLGYTCSPPMRGTWKGVSFSKVNGELSAKRVAASVITAWVALSKTAQRYGIA
mmetsp:Transcript_66210/g.181517  ORF Transcript_66210/g.181517 Transcript_66210/m.181517 type:complete len:288 (+) Transcript_66210:154-1017(+)